MSHQPSQRVRDAWNGIQPDARGAAVGDYVMFRMTSDRLPIYGCGKVRGIDHEASAIHTDAVLDNGESLLGIVIAMRNVTAVLDTAHGVQVVARYLGASTT